MKRFFLGGLAALLPTILTLWILVAGIGFVGDYIAKPATRAIHWALITNRLGQSLLESTTPIRVHDPAYVDDKRLAEGETAAQAAARAQRRATFFLDLSKVDRDRLYADLSRIIPPVTGLAIGLVLIFVLGFLLRGYLGRYLFGKGEKLLFSFPLVRTIYPYAKKVVGFFLTDQSRLREFQSVVAVPYPSKGMFTLGFVTSDGLRSLNDRQGGTYVSVFLPSSPTPMTGYVCFVRKEDIVPLALTLDQTMGLIVSGGVIVPEDEVVDPQDRKRLLGVEEAPSLVRRPDAASPAGIVRPTVD